MTIDAEPIALEAFHAAGIAEASFDDIARLAAQLCDKPTALITLVDGERQMFKARIGYDGPVTAPLHVGFCPIVVRDAAPLVIADAHGHPVHAANLAVTQGGVRFYAGVPLMLPDGAALGTLCVLDQVPGDLTDRQRDGLQALARQVVGQMELRLALRRAGEAGVRAERAAASLMAQARRMELLAGSAAQMLNATDAAAMVRELYGSIAATFELDVFFNYACQAGGLGLIACAGLTPDQTRAVARLDFGQTICGLVALTRQPVHVTEIQAGDDPQAAFLKMLGLETYASIPLLARGVEPGEPGALLGTLSFGRRTGPFSDGEIKVLFTLAATVAMALERLAATGALAASSQRGAFLVQLADHLAGLDEPEQMMPAATRLLAEHLGVECAVPLENECITAPWSSAPPAPGDTMLVGDVAVRVRAAVERARLDAALRDSERELRFAMQAARFGAWSLSTATGELTMSETCKKNFGRPPDAPFTYDQLRDAIHPDDQARMAAAVAHSLATGADYDIEYRVVTLAGDVRWIGIRAQPSFGGDGAVLGLRGISVDINQRRADEERLRAQEALLREANEGLETRVAERTAELSHALGQLHREVLDREQAEEALRQSQKMEAVGQLTGGIAHDFNNLLQGITGSLDLVRRRIAQGRVSDVERLIDGAVASSNRAAALTHRLLAFARRQPLDPKPVRANPLVASMEDLLRRTIGEAIRLDLVLDAGLWLTQCDPHQLESALLNLVINARDAMPMGGCLTIATSNVEVAGPASARSHGVAPGHYVVIAVSDTGTGMSPDVAAKAFEPFFTTKPIGTGTGLGLSMIYGFTHQSGGHARITSEPGAGTTVRLYLPRHDGDGAEDEQAALDHVSPATVAGEVVLVVEDEPVVRALVIEVLHDQGYRALAAGDGPAGLAILQSRQQIDLLVTDIGLPGLGGRQMARAARIVRPDLKVLFMTAYAEEAATAGFLEPGMAMITKPFAMHAMASQIRGMLEAGRTQPA